MAEFNQNWVVNLQGETLGLKNWRFWACCLVVLNPQSHEYHVLLFDTNPIIFVIIVEELSHASGYKRKKISYEF